MKEIVKNGALLWLRTIVVTFMCLIICVSMSVLISAGFSENLGYYAYGQKEDSKEPELLYEYNIADGEDTKKAEFEEKGYTVTTQKKTRITDTGNVVFLIVSQIFCTLLTIAFIYPNLWQLGAKDSNLVKFKHKESDPLKGLKIGLVGTIPSFLVFVGFVVCRFVYAKLPVAIYRFLNCTNYSFVYLIGGEGSNPQVTVGEVAIWRFVLLFLLLLIIPAIAFAAYLLGFKDISLGERFIYKNAKRKK